MMSKVKLLSKKKKNTYTNQTDLQVKGSCVKPNSVKVDVTVFVFIFTYNKAIKPFNQYFNYTIDYCFKIH